MDCEGSGHPGNVRIRVLLAASQWSEVPTTVAATREVDTADVPSTVVGSSRFASQNDDVSASNHGEGSVRGHRQLVFGRHRQRQGRAVRDDKYRWHFRWRG